MASLAPPEGPLAHSKTSRPRLLSRLRKTSRKLLSFPKKIRQKKPKKDSSEILYFLIHDCPAELIPAILSFGGPSLTRTLLPLFPIVDDDHTWRTLSTDYQKWNPDIPRPLSWKDYYYHNPIIGIDFKSMEECLRTYTNTPKHSKALLPIPQKLCVWLQPDSRHQLSHSIVIQAPRQSVVVQIRTTSGRAKIVSHLNQRNAPIFRVTSGNLVLRHVDLLHSSRGVDLWQGNAAIHVQPFAPQARVSTLLDHVDIVSETGRGLVSIGSKTRVNIVHSHIHDCAATGVYVHESKMAMKWTDIVNNGIGGRSGRFGTLVSRGHTGCYIEEGEMDIEECCIAENTASGLAVLSEKVKLSLKKSDLINNGHSPVVLPQEPLIPHEMKDNCISPHGQFKKRSNIALKAAIEEGTMSTRSVDELGELTEILREIGLFP